MFRTIKVNQDQKKPKLSKFGKKQERKAQLSYCTNN